MWLRRSILLLFTCAILAPVADASAGGFVLVRSAKNPNAKLSRGAVKEMFSGRVTTWSSGDSIVLVIGSEESPAMAWLADALFGVSTKTLLTKIKQQVFRGEMPHPLSAEDDAATIARIQSRSGVVGFVSDAAARSLPADLAVIAIDH